MKVAVLGAGRMGRRHVRVAAECRLSLVGISDLRTESLDEAKREFTLTDAQLFTSSEELLRTHRPEVVIVATTAPSHAHLSILAANHGANFILCEKPFAVSLHECDQILTVCAKHGCKIAVNHQMRFMEQYTKIKSLITAPEFGGLTSMTVVAGNMGLAMNGSHYFEAFRYLTDDLPHAVTAWLTSDKVSNPRGPQFADRGGFVRVTGSRGSRLTIEAGTDQGHGMTVTYAGRYGLIFVDEISGKMLYSARKEEDRALPMTRFGTSGISYAADIAPAEVIASSAKMLSALIEGSNFCSGEQGRSAVAALVATHVSDEMNHSEVLVDDKLPCDRSFPWA